MNELRRPELAGTWYPDSAEGCRADFAGYAREAVSAPQGGLVGAVVPHAGWAFSGSIAFNALSELASRCGDGVDTLVLFAGHLGVGAAPTVMTRGDFWTPCGILANDVALAERVGEVVEGIRIEDPSRHSQDNSTEVELPMLRELFAGERRLVVVGAPPDGNAQALGRAVARAAAGLGRRAVWIGSTDLTHYGPNYGFTSRGRGDDAEKWVREENDARFLEATLAGDGEAVLGRGVGERSACCPGAVAAAMAAARESGAVIEPALLRYATSREIHRADSFVGYAGVVF